MNEEMLKAIKGIQGWITFGGIVLILYIIWEVLDFWLTVMSLV